MEDSMPQFCSACGAQMADGAAACPACGKSSATSAGGGTAAAPAQSGGLSDTAAGAIAYITIIPAILFLVMEPYNKKPFVRFHAFQSLFFFLSWFLLNIICTIIPIVGWLLLPLVMLGMIITAVITIIKASKGEKFKLPVIGNFAEQQAGS
jgi:uncharacterized membrane protein